MLKHRLTRVLVFTMLILTSVSAMAEETGYFDWLKNYDWKEMRYELEYGIKAKGFGDAVSTIDGKAGASDRSFREWYGEFTVLPFEESELSLTYGYSKRTYTNSYERSNNGSASGAKKDMGTETHEIILGNTWNIGSLMLRPELALRETEFRYNSRVGRTTELRIYPKITYNVTKDLNLYTRGYFGERTLTKGTNSSGAKNGFDESHEKSRMEYGSRYKFNREHALSVAYAQDKTHQTHRNYNVKLNQIRLRYHWTPNRKITIVPHWFIGTNGSRLQNNDSTNPARSGSIYKNRVGINSNFRVTNSVTLLAQIHYEWWRDTTGNAGSRYSSAVQKDNLFLNLGLKHQF